MMSELQQCHALLDSALKDIDRAVKRVKSASSKQITKSDDIDYFRSVAYAWFHSWKPQLSGAALDLAPLNTSFGTLLDSTAKKAARSTYLTALQQSRKQLAALRRDIVSVSAEPNVDANDDAPDFSVIVADATMQRILVERWNECRRCVDAKAYLAATVMMGGLLEALFVACANRLSDKSILFKAKSTPIDGKTKKPLPLQQWTLRPYIDVAHELGWISRSGKDIAEVLRDYRNYVHPEKQRSHGVSLNVHDAQMFWDVTKNLSTQLLSKFGTKAA